MQSPTTVDRASAGSPEHRRRPGPVDRRVGSAIAVAVDLVLLYLVNVRPGWQAVPFLTHGMNEVLPLLNASFIIAGAVNLVLVVVDGREAKAVGDVVTTAVGLAVLIRLWEVFPFDLGSFSFDATALVRVALGLAVVGTAIALVVQVVALVSVLVRGGARRLD